MNKVISTIALFVLVVSLVFVPIGLQYKDMSYHFSFDEISEYEDLFFEVDLHQYNIYGTGSIYGIGSYDMYADRLIEKELSTNLGVPPYSDTEKSYERKGVEIYPEFLIQNRNDILSECSFEKISLVKSFLLSFLFNRLNNVTTVRINEGYLSPEINDGRFSEDIIRDFLSQGSGIINAGVFHLFDKTYLMADYAFFNEIDVEKYSYKDDVKTKKCVFEIIPSEVAEEIVEIKYSSQASYGDSYKAVPISIWSIVTIFAVFILLKKRVKK